MKNNVVKNTLSIGMVFLIMFSGVLVGQKKVFTLEQAIDAALRNNRDIQQSLMDVNIAEEQVDEAFGYALPSVDLSAQYYHFLEKPKTAFPDFAAMLNNATYGVLFNEGVIPEDNSKLQPMQSSLQSFSQTNNYEAKVQVTQVLFSSAVFTGIGASKTYVKLSEEQLKAQVAATVMDVKRAFYGALLTDQLLQITEASLENAQDNYKSVMALRKEGLASEYDELQVEVMVENIKPTLRGYRINKVDALNALKMLIGVNQDVEISLEGVLSYNPEKMAAENEMVLNALKYNYDLSVLEHKKLIDEATIDVDRADYYPTLAAFGSYTNSGLSDEFDFTTYNSSMVGLQLSLNLFSGGSTSAKVQQGKITVEQTESQISLLKDYVSSQVRSKYMEVQKIEDEIAAIDKNVKLAEKAYSIAKERYNQGSGTQLEVKNSDLDLRSARINRINAIYDYLIAKAELDVLVGAMDKSYFNTVKSLNKN